MQSTCRPPILSFALKSLTAAVASAVFLSSAVNAAGLGKLTVLSALGQPLRAEIELTAVSNEEAPGLQVKLASPDVFRTANIDFNPALLSLRFAVEQRNGRQVIKITSTQPLNEPFVDMLLELSWGNGRLVREYTFLLDPAELRATQLAQVAPPVDVPGQRAASAETPAARPEPAEASPSRAGAERPAGAPEQPGQAANTGRAAAATHYRVKPGDTLGRIAGQLKPVDISLDMMLVALYRANPDAFIGNNMNRLKSGRILSVPDAGTIRGTSEGEAHGVVVAHAADFNAYRNKLAGQVAASTPVKAPQASQSVAGKITAKVEERPTAANESQDRLRLSKAMPPAAPAAQGATASTEDTIAREKALTDARTRVKELEKNVSELEKLMTIKNQAGAAAAQNAASAAKPAQAKPAQAKPAQAKPAQAKPAAPEPSFVDMLMNNISYVGAGAAVLLLALLGISQRRKRKNVVKAAPAEPSILGVPTQTALFAETGGQSVDTNNSVFNSSFAPSASQLDTNEVDPVAEADVYIAYGRDAQAEEILKEALRNHPERYPVRLKLLEVYAARKDLRAFEAQASDLYSMTRGQGDEWAQAAALGLSIDPLNPLYSGAGGSVAPAPTPEERSQQALLSQQLEDAFRGGERKADTGFGMNLMADTDATALPEVAVGVPAAGAPAAEVEDEHVLDFDLGGLSFEPVSSIDPIAMSEPSRQDQRDQAAVPDLEFGLEPPAAAPEEVLDLTFDMNFDRTATAAAPADDKADEDLALDMALGGPVTDVDMASLAKELDLPPLPAAPEDATPAAELKDPLFDLNAMNFDLPAASAAQPLAAPGESKDPLFDLDAMDFGQPAAAALAATEAPADDVFALPELPAEMSAPGATGPGAAGPGAAAPHLDMSDIDLELPAMEAAALSQVESAEAGAAEMSAAYMEMETKLDLAIAYQEIGDKEGARELLDEVIKGGSSEQVGKANAMRAKLE